jgi:hypothetical protein
MIKPPTVEPILYETYLSVVEKSDGVIMFQSNFAMVNGKFNDVTKEGELSCAFYLSFILLGFGLLQTLHTSTTGTIRDLKASGWEIITEPRAGAVVVWGEPNLPDYSGQLDNNPHRHIGFCINNDEAMSNNADTHCVSRHPINYRAVEAIYWHPRLGKQ